MHVFYSVSLSFPPHSLSLNRSVVRATRRGYSSYPQHASLPVYNRAESMRVAVNKLRDVI